MKISNSINSLYPVYSPASSRNKSSSGLTEKNTTYGQQGINRTQQEKVVDGEVLHRETPQAYEVFSKSRVFQQTAINVNSETLKRQAITSYETNSTAVQNDESSKGQNIDLYI